MMKLMTRAMQVSPSDEIVPAAGRMRDANVSTALVIDDGGAVVGVLSERDMARKIIAEGLSCHGRLVSEVMSPVEGRRADPYQHVLAGVEKSSRERTVELPDVVGSEDMGEILPAWY